MTYEQVKNILNPIPNGQLITVELITEQKQVNAQAKKNGISVKKHSFNVCRKGIEYSNTNYIKNIQSELNYEIGDRINGTKVDKTFADSTLGNKLVDLYSMDCIADRQNGNKPINVSKAEYIVNDNGVETVVDSATLKAMGVMQPSFFNKAENNKVKYETMLTMKAEWEKDKDNYPQTEKDKLARLIRDVYNKLFSPKCESIISINGMTE